MKKILSIINKNPKILLPNKEFLRNDGEVMNEGQKTWIKAKKIIPGGTMLFLKILICIYQNFGQHILAKQKVVLFGILSKINISIFHIWVLEQIFLDIQTKKLIMQ